MNQKLGVSKISQSNLFSFFFFQNLVSFFSQVLADLHLNKFTSNRHTYGRVCKSCGKNIIDHKKFLVEFLLLSSRFMQMIWQFYLNSKNNEVDTRIVFNITSCILQNTRKVRSATTTHFRVFGVVRL